MKTFQVITSDDSKKYEEEILANNSRDLQKDEQAALFKSLEAISNLLNSDPKPENFRNKLFYSLNVLGQTLQILYPSTSPGHYANIIKVLQKNATSEEKAILDEIKRSLAQQSNLDQLACLQIAANEAPLLEGEIQQKKLQLPKIGQMFFNAFGEGDLQPAEADEDFSLKELFSTKEEKEQEEDEERQRVKVKQDEFYESEDYAAYGRIYKEFVDTITNVEDEMSLNAIKASNALILKANQEIIKKKFEEFKELCLENPGEDLDANRIYYEKMVAEKGCLNDNNRLLLMAVSLDKAIALVKSPFPERCVKYIDEAFSEAKKVFDAASNSSTSAPLERRKAPSVFSVSAPVERRSRSKSDSSAGGLDSAQQEKINSITGALWKALAIYCKYNTNTPEKVKGLVAAYCRAMKEIFGAGVPGYVLKESDFKNAIDILKNFREEEKFHAVCDIISQVDHDDPSIQVFKGAVYSIISSPVNSLPLAVAASSTPAKDEGKKSKDAPFSEGKAEKSVAFEELVAAPRIKKKPNILASVGGPAMIFSGIGSVLVGIAGLVFSLTSIGATFGLSSPIALPGAYLSCALIVGGATMIAQGVDLRRVNAPTDSPVRKREAEEGKPAVSRPSTLSLKPASMRPKPSSSPFSFLSSQATQGSTTPDPQGSINSTYKLSK